MVNDRDLASQGDSSMEAPAKLIIDGLLVTGFGVQHSLLATSWVKQRIKQWTGMEPLAWRSVESLCNVVYILFAAALWQPTHDIVWQFTGITAAILYVIVALS